MNRSENRSISTLEELYETRNKDLTRKACFTGVGIFQIVSIRIIIKAILVCRLTLG